MSRNSILIGTATLMLASPSFGLGKASLSDEGAIQAELKSVARIEAELQKFEVEISAAKGHRREELLSESAVKESERETAYNRAIWLTIIAYDIFPGCRYSLSSGVQVSPSVKQGQTVEWLPYFSDHKPVVLIGPSGQPVSQVASRMTTAAAVTASDGTSRIYPEAFGHPPSPGELAAALVHEKAHFDIDTTRGRGDVLNRPEAEAAAYQAQLDAIKAGKIAIHDAGYEETLRAQLETYAKRGKEERQRVGRTPTVIVINDEYLRLSDVTPHTNEELAAIKRNALALRDQVYFERGERLAREDFERQMQERNAELDRKRILDDINRRRAAEQAMSEAQRNILRNRAQVAFGTMKHDALRMQEIVLKLCNGDDPVLPGDANPALRAEASNFAYYREEFVQTGERADTLPASVPFSRDWIYWGLEGCGLKTMRDLFTKNPPLAVRANPADEAWLVKEALAVRPVVDAPVPGGRPVGGDESPSGDTGDNSSRVPSSVQGTAWGQLNSWPHF